MLKAARTRRMRLRGRLCPPAAVPLQRGELQSLLVSSVSSLMPDALLDDSDCVDIARTMLSRCEGGLATVFTPYACGSAANCINKQKGTQLQAAQRTMRKGFACSKHRGPKSWGSGCTDGVDTSSRFGMKAGSLACRHCLPIDQVDCPSKEMSGRSFHIV